MCLEPGIRLTESEYAPGLVLPPHRHEEASVALVVAGRVEETAERRTSASSSCSVVFKPAGVVHGNRFGPEGARLFNVTWETGAPPPALATRGYAWMHGGGTCEVALRLYREFLRGDDPARLAMEGLVLELAAGEGNAPRGTPPRWLRDVQELLRERFSESLRVADLAQAAGVHPVHLGMIFLANLEIGFLTPPVGLNLFFSSYRFGRPLPEVCRAVMPLFLALLAGVLLITYVPWLSTGLLQWAR